MLTDTWTVMRKELLEILRPDGRALGGAKNVLVLVAIAGLLFPLQSGRAWFTSWMTVYSACFPAILMANYAADSFAGERERHTLETLLASRLSGVSILLGKVAAIVGFGWGLIVVGQLLAVVALNAAVGGGHLLFFRPAIAAALVVVAALLPLVLTSAGVVVSMTAPTARVAGQRMLVPFVFIYGMPFALPAIAAKLGFGPSLASLTPAWTTIGVCIATGGASLVLLAVAIRRFKREKLVLA